MRLTNSLPNEVRRHDRGLNLPILLAILLQRGYPRWTTDSVKSVPKFQLSSAGTGVCSDFFIAAVVQEGVAGSVHCGLGHTGRFVTVVALLSKVFLGFNSRVHAEQKNWYETILRKDLVPHPYTPMQKWIAEKTYFHIACRTEREYNFTVPNHCGIARPCIYLVYITPSSVHH